MRGTLRLKLALWGVLYFCLLVVPVWAQQPGQMMPPAQPPGAGSTGPSGALDQLLDEISPDLAEKVSGATVGTLYILYLLAQMFLYLFLYICWVYATDWVNQDRYFRKQSRNWNVAMFLPFILAFLFTGFLCHPFVSLITLSVSFWIGYFIHLLAFLIPFITYVVKHNRAVAIEDRVFTGPHIRRWTATRLQAIGIKVRSEQLGVDDVGPPIKLTARGGATDRDNNVNLLTARQAPGFLPARELLAQALDNRADSVMLDYSQQSVSVRFQVDGVWHPGENMEREPGDMLLAVLKVLCALNPNERRARQQGVFGAEYQGRKMAPRFMSQGTQTGERVLIQFPDPDVRKKRITDLGMREKMWDDLRPVLESRTGMVVLSAPPGAGLTSLVHAVLLGMDRYTRGFVGVEDVAAKDVEVENVPITTFNAAAGEAPLTVLPKLIREYPDVLVVPDMKDADSAELLCDQTGLDRTVITTARAKETAEAVLRVMMLKMPGQKYADALKAAVNVRLIRKLCEKCKEAYAPPPQLLQQLGIPQGRIQALYRPPTPNPDQPQEPCKHCRGIGYYGRTGIFETLIVDDQVRQALLKKPQLDVVRQAARKAGMRTLQEEGLLLVVTGVTSLPELQRALKET
ncbi:MAG TPA: ATPase, T2SS/T4P/T4SS family [Pirellulales bacterium]|nr:ATPase, T2SS/T4P/T4SS family [Pirellulales bacterium]